MILVCFSFFFFFSLSFTKMFPMKLVISMEFFYIVIIFMSQLVYLLTFNLGMYVMVFSAAEGVLGLSLVMDTSKLYSFGNKLFFGSF